MNILLTGASGFIGGHLLQALQAAGHQVKPISRKHGVNFNTMLTPEAWLPHLQDVDVVINSVGIIAETAGQTFENLHYRAPAALFQASAQSKVKRVIQISALGADEQGFAPYQLSKKAADDVLRGLPLDWFILRPSLVYGQGGKSSAMFKLMSSLPIIPLLGDGKQRIQPVHISDVVATVLQTLTAEPTQRTLDVVGAYPLTFVDWLQSMRQREGKKKALTLPTPFGLIVMSAKFMRYFVPMLHPDNLRMLQNGNTAPVEPLAAFLGRMPLSVEQAP